jgi:hypothetical protein
MTTHQTSVELIKEGKIKMVKDKPYSQTDYLVINENNEFNKIYKMLIEIENLLNKMKQSLDKIRHSALQTTVNSVDDEATANIETRAAIEINDYFVKPYTDTIDMMLKNILNRTLSANHSEKDVHILTSVYIRILNQLTYPSDNLVIIENRLRYNTNKMTKPFRATKYIRDYAKKNGIDLNVRDDVLKLVEKFRKNFLT